MDRILELKNKHAGERCFILGNGPSLTKLDLELLKTETFFGTNSIYYLFDKLPKLPDYYVVEDKFVAEDRRTEISQLDESITVLRGTYLDYCLEETKNTIKIPVIFDYSAYSDFPKFGCSLESGIWVGGTVSYLCMQIAYYMGFSEVYLIGFDHAYSIPENTIRLSPTELLSQGADPNHFDDKYFGVGKRWHDPQLDRMEKAYKKAKKYFENSGRKIFNATLGGKLEVFDRVDYYSLFGE